MKRGVNNGGATIVVNLTKEEAHVLWHLLNHSPQWDTNEDVTKHMDGSLNIPNLGTDLWEQIAHKTNLEQFSTL